MTYMMQKWRPEKGLGPNYLLLAQAMTIFLISLLTG